MSGDLLLTQALIINAVVLFVVLKSDLGPRRTVTKFRVLRPLVVAGAIVPLFIKHPQTSGTGLTLEIVAVAAGVTLGLLTAILMRVYRSPDTGEPVTCAGFGYAALWTAVIGARAAFSYGSVHWFSRPLGSWLTQHSVAPPAITDALIFMAVAMVLTRVIQIAARSLYLPLARSQTRAPRPQLTSMRRVVEQTALHERHQRERATPRSTSE
jgi:hypothetical protein